jgi:hypothetical protein
MLVVDRNAGRRDDEAPIPLVQRVPSQSLEACLRAVCRDADDAAMRAEMVAERPEDAHAQQTR